MLLIDIGFDYSMLLLVLSYQLNVQGVSKVGIENICIISAYDFFFNLGPTPTILLFAKYAKQVNEHI